VTTNDACTPPTTEPGIAVQRRRVAIRLVLLALGIAIMAGVWGALVYDRTPPLPARSDIASMTFAGPLNPFQSDSYIPSFAIPEKHWDAILAALMPCKPDASRTKWISFCTVSIGTQAGKVYRVDVYWLEGDHPGAFSVSPHGWFSRQADFRGGDTIQLRDAVVAAYEEHARLVSTPTNK